MKKVAFLALSLGLCLSVGLVGCSEAERLYNCSQICDRYSDCIDDSIDKSDCTSTCEDHGEDDMDFATKASECEDCLDDKSCTEAAVECATACAEVVATST